jgi:hypothetical protein
MLIMFAQQWWIKSWTSEGAQVSTYHVPSLIQYSLQRLAAVASENHTLVYWVGVYTALSFISCLFGTLRYGTVIPQAFTLFLADAFELKVMSSRLLFGHLEFSSTTCSMLFFGHLSGIPFPPQEMHQY